MKRDKPPEWQRARNNAAMAVMETHGYEAMQAYLIAVDAGLEPPCEYSSAVKPASVYLAVFGDGDPAYLKIGIADKVAVRMKQHRTSCPLPLLHVYEARLPSRMEAGVLEARLLAFMGESRLHGEWSRVAGPIPELVESLSRAASDALKRPIVFTEKI